jgi:hypothetical protein
MNCMHVTRLQDAGRHCCALPYIEVSDVLYPVGLTAFRMGLELTSQNIKPCLPRGI